MIKLEEGEQILYVARKHWFIFASETIFLLVFALLPAALLFIPATLFDQALAAIGIGEHHIPVITFFWSLWLMLLWVLFALFWTNYYLDVWILTNHRVLDIDQIGLFHRKISAIRYDHIQDATVHIPGLLATMLNFGTVEIRTASNETFKFKGVAHPSFLKERIMSEHHRVHAA